MTKTGGHFTLRISSTTHTRTQEHGFDYTFERTHSTASLNDVAFDVFSIFPIETCLPLRVDFTRLTPMARKQTTLKAGKAGKSKTSRNVSSETKSRKVVRLILYRPMPRGDLYEETGEYLAIRFYRLGPGGRIQLPRELRDQIWSLAIRDDHPGAHIFGQYVTGSHSFQSWRGLSFDVAAPSWGRYFESLDEDRSDENISTYLIDGGLWTACHESRCIMEDHFKQSGRQLAPRHPNDRRSSFSEKDLFKMASSGYFNGNPLEIVTVFPYRDLFIVQHEDLDKIDWGYLGFGFCGVGHIAIEYD
ncbi:uncharacterized protein FFB14_07021 [Fusarium fujikuroi]|nr:uncharacterized protein FFB14_07021 [Fusarium fujikuroi]